MKLNRLQLISDLPDWKPSDMSGYTINAKRLMTLAAKAGSDGHAFQKACARLKACLSEQEVSNFLMDSVHIRAYAYLLSSDDLFVKDNYPKSEVLQRIKEQRWPLGRLTLTNLVRVFANNMDKRSLDETDTLGSFISEAFQEMPRTLSGDLKLMQASRAEIFDSEGPRRLAVNAISLGSDLTEYLRKAGLAGLKVSALVKLSFRHYFIEQLENLIPGEDSPVLAELRKPEVHMAVLGKGKLLGHRALEILIDRTPESGPSDAWQRAVVGIAGDPRVGRRAKSFQNWWQFLGDARAKKVVGWLSRLDLKIFLEVLEASARTTNTESIKRMYPPRKKFMEGLLEQGMVIQSRLFLSRDASRYLKASYSEEDIPEHALIRSGHTSVIYLELTGGLHMIEGTDNMKIKILDALPPRPQILNFAVRMFADSDFRANIVLGYRREQASSGRTVVPGRDYIDQSHHPITWQASAIQLFHKRGIRYQASDFFSSSDYRAFKSSYSRDYWS